LVAAAAARARTVASFRCLGLTAVAGHLGDTVETVSKVYPHWLRDDRGVPAW
jgi:hypothetical protein